MRELSSAPEGHLFRTPGSPAAERRGNQEFAAQLAHSPSAQRRENQLLARYKLASMYRYKHLQVYACIYL